MGTTDSLKCELTQASALNGDPNVTNFLNSCTRNEAAPFDQWDHKMHVLSMHTVSSMHLARAHTWCKLNLLKC